MQRENGRVIVWTADKGYGLIRSAQDGKDVFLHAKDLRLNQRSPRVNDQVTYLLEVSDTDKPSAQDVLICGFGWSYFTLLCASFVPALGVYAYGIWRYHLTVYPAALVYVCMSLVTAMAYHRDARAEKTGARRVPERDLHVLEILGGWPGGLIAQLCLRHKLKKLSYQLIFWLIVFGHGLAWFALAAGSPIRKFASDMPDLSGIKRVMTAWVPTNSVQRLQALVRIALPGGSVPAPSSVAVHPPAEDYAWTNEPPAEPSIVDPAVCRTQVIVHQKSRRVQGVIKAVSLARGLLVSLPSDFGGDGVIAPPSLIADFHRRFSIGERVTVAIQGVRMQGSYKQMDLLLVETGAAVPQQQTQRGNK